MTKHTCPISPIDYAEDVACRCLEGLAGFEVSSSDRSACRRIAVEYMQQLQEAEQTFDDEHLTRAVDTGHAHLTRDYR